MNKRIIIILITIILALTSITISYFIMNDNKIIDGNEYVHSIKWNPNSNSITFIDVDINDHYSYIYQKNIDSKETTKLIDTPISSSPSSDTGTSYSWFDNQIVYVSRIYNEKEAESTKLNIFNLDSKENKTILEIKGYNNYHFNILNPIFSDTGEFVLFFFYCNNNTKNNFNHSILNQSGFYIIDSSGENLKKILDDKYHQWDIGITFFENYIYFGDTEDKFKLTNRFSLESEQIENLSSQDINIVNKLKSEYFYRDNSISDQGKIMLSPDKNKYLLEIRKGSDMGFSVPYIKDYYIKYLK